MFVNVSLPWSAYMCSQHEALLLVVVNEGDRLAGVVNEGGLRVLVPGNVINTVCTVIVSVRVCEDV